jgi:Tol biopolymer transport system component
VQITTAEGDDFGPAWSPDGLRVAFARTLSDSQFLRVVNADGTDEQALFNDGKYAVPDWIAGS